MDDIAKLAERVEAGSGPDRELDADVFQRIGGAEWERALIRVSEPCGCPEEQAIDYARTRCSPRYTASLDASVALLERVLPGWSGCVDFVGSGHSAATLIGPLKELGTDFDGCDVEIRDEAIGEAKSPARALLAATLRALHHGR